MNDFTYLKDKDFKKGRRYIGASDIPTLALFNVKYNQTPLTLWEEKTGRRDPFRGNERTRAGHELEHIVLKWGLEKLTENNNYYYSNDYLKYFLISRLKGINDCVGLFSFTEARHPKYNFIVSHADLIDNNTEFIMEGKTTGFFGGKRNDDINLGYDKNDMTANGIPSAVYLQVQTQMLCYGISAAYVSVMIDTGIHRLYGPIKAHKKTQEKILAIADKFWWYVENDKPPKPNTWNDIVILNPNLDRESKTVIAGVDEEKVKQMKQEKRDIAKKIKKLEAREEDIKNAIGLLIGENSYLETSSGESLAKAFEVTREYLNFKKIKKENPRKYKNLKKDGLIYDSTSRQLRY